MIVRGSPEVILRDVLMFDWPFKRIDYKSDWYIIDRFGNEVTDYSMSDVPHYTTIHTRNQDEVNL
ncbi:MAG: hypothetical protein RTU92_00095 [Candidatus Thorarchaeota archaeon]